MSTSTITHDDSTMPMPKAGTQRRVGLFAAASAAEPATPPVADGGAEADTWEELTSAPPVFGALPGAPAVVGAFAGMPYPDRPPTGVGEYPGPSAAPGPFAGARAAEAQAEGLPVAVADRHAGSEADSAWSGPDAAEPIEKPAVEAVKPAPVAARIATARPSPRPLKKVLILTAVILAGTALLVAAIYLGLRTRPTQEIASVSNQPPTVQTDPAPLPPAAEPGAVPSDAVPAPSVGASGLPPAPDLGRDAALPPDVANAPLPRDPAAGASPTGPVPPDAALTNPVPGAPSAGAPVPGAPPAGDPFAAEPPAGAEPAPSFTGGDFSAPDRSFTDPYSTGPTGRSEPGIRPRGYPHRGGSDRYPSGTDRLNRPLDSLGATGGDDEGRPHRQPLGDAVSGLGGLGGR